MDTICDLVVDRFGHVYDSYHTDRCNCSPWICGRLTVHSPVSASLIDFYQTPGNVISLASLDDAHFSNGSQIQRISVRLQSTILLKTRSTCRSAIICVKTSVRRYIPDIDAFQQTNAVKFKSQL